MKQNKNATLKFDSEKFAALAKAQPSGHKPNCQFKASGDGAATIWLYDAIGFWGITSAMFAQELQALGKDITQINLRIDSPGGSCFDAAAIYSALASHPAEVIVDIDSRCWSAATIIAQAGDTRRMSESGLWMMHNPAADLWLDCVVNKDTTAEAEIARISAEIKLSFELWVMVKNTMLAVYQSQTGKTADEITAWLDAAPDGTWWNAEQAKANGFIDEVTAKSRLAAARFGAALRVQDFAAIERNPIVTDASGAETNGDADADKEAVDWKFQNLMLRRSIASQLGC